MIELIFYYGTDVILVRITDKNIEFGNSVYGNKLATIDGLHLDKSGTIEEFPDLKERTDWKIEAIKRFKEHIKKLNNEEEISDYIINELKKKGYIPRYKQLKGFRPTKIKQ
jgi:hypothetical protein